jgi:hypothetical protein
MFVLRLIMTRVLRHCCRFFIYFYMVIMPDLTNQRVVFSPSNETVTFTMTFIIYDGLRICHRN